MKSNYIITAVLLLVLAFMNACKNKDIDVETFKIEKEAAFPSANSVTFKGSYSFSGNVNGMKINIGLKENLADAAPSEMQLEGTDFSVTVDGLIPDTTYFYRYSVDLGGATPILTEIHSFTTLAATPVAPVVLIHDILPTDDDSLEFRVKCEVVSNGGAEVVERGICYNNYGEPSVLAGNLTLQDSLGSGTGPYYVYMRGLAHGKRYHVRAYAKNAAGKLGESKLPALFFNTPTPTEELINIDVNWYPENGGIVYGGGSVHFGDTIMLEAVPNEGYRFEHWDDGDTLNPRPVRVTVGSTYKAIFHEVVTVHYNVTTHANPVEGGRVEGGGQHEEGKQIQLSAIANTGYNFKHWNDGSIQNPRPITVNTDMEFTAFFKKTYTITVQANDGGTAHIGNTTSTTATFEHGDTCTVHATAIEGYVFVNWMEDNIGVSTDADYDFEVTEDHNLVAHFTTANTITVMFRVTLQDGNSPVGTTIRFLNLNTQEQLNFSLNDETGYFRQNIPAGNYQITVAKTGYVSIIKEYDLSNVINEISLGKFSMVPNYDYVDLGLPSGTLWATCNVGAETPEGYGNYFAWGETQPKSTYFASNYQHFHEGINSITKYCNNPSYGYNGYTDNLTVLQSTDDAATTQLDGDNAWRIPTKEEWEELYQYTTPTWTNRNGIYGYLFTARNNDNYIFLPAAGHQYSSSPSYIGTQGYYWSSSLYLGDPNRSWYFSFLLESCDVYNSSFRYYGMTLRPVRSAQ